MAKKKVLTPLEVSKINLLYYLNDRPIEKISKLVGYSPPIIARNLFPTRDQWYEWKQQQEKEGRL